MPIDISKNPARQRGRRQGGVQFGLFKRQPGETHPSAKLTEALVVEMRALFNSGVSAQKVHQHLVDARGVRVSLTQVRAACSGKHWGDFPDRREVKAPSPPPYSRPKKKKLGPQRGERNTQAKLNRKLADCILIMHEEYGVGYKRLKAFLWDWHGVAVSIACIRQVCNYERWLEPIDIWD